MTIYDCFPFFQELDILEWRLEELYRAVDWFVLVESTHTHKGDEKPLHYARNRQRFAKWNDKVLHVVVDQDTIDGHGLPAIRRREMGQRNAILDGLKRETDPAAIVLISDLDEIPRREIVKTLAQSSIPDGAVIRFIQRLYYYNLNTSAPKRPWPGTRAARLADVRALSPHVIRTGLGQPDTEYPQHGFISDAGWHFSYFGGTVKIQEKMAAFLHQELVSDTNSSAATIEARIAAGLDVWGRAGEQEFVIGPAADLPWAIRCAPDRWLDHFHAAWRPVLHETWYSAEQAAYIAWLAQQAPQGGAMVEIGCWEGRSTVCLAQSIAPRPLIAVDHFEGNNDEYDGHPSAAVATERDIAGTFHDNIERLTPGNVYPYGYDWRAWIEGWANYARRGGTTLTGWDSQGRIAFLHLDAAHDYTSVADCLRAVLPFVVPGGVLCGDDFYADGVQQAVREILPDVQDVGGRLWVWQNMEGV